MYIDRVQLEADYEAFMKALKDTPEKFPANKSFGISRIQRALKLSYGRAFNLQNVAIARGVLKQLDNTYKVMLVKKDT